MTVRLLPEQIPQYWEYIKYAAVLASGHKDEAKIKQYCLGLLVNLMTDKYQCFFGLGEDRRLMFLVIGSLLQDAGNVKRYFLEVIFGFEPTSKEWKREHLEPIRAFAQNIGCDELVSIASNPKVWAVADQMGFEFYAKIHTLKMTMGGE